MSSIPAARAALYQLLAAASADPLSPLAGVQIAFGPPDQYEQQEVIALLGISEAAETSIALSPQTVRDEQYGIEIALKVYDPAGTALNVDSRAWAMYEAVRALVKANLQLDGAVQWALPIRPRSDGPMVPVGDDGATRLPGWVIRIDMTIGCKARS